MNFVEGEVLLFDKPYGWTSFQLVNKVRWLLCQSLKVKKLKVGHAGTLDPLATGLIILCTGRATKKISELTGFEKEYIAEIKFGETTPSFDMETAVDQTYKTNHITKELILSALHIFTGEIQQIPPLFSAKYVNGTRAYHYARKGSDIELNPTMVTIKELELLNFDNSKAILRILCSKGTYIRSLANDLGKNLNSGAYLTALKRTKIGDFKLIDAQTIENFEKSLSLA
jgi:tRNA pseudouridine55 synthase